MTSSFTARTPGGAPISWDSEHGFGGPLAGMLNRGMRSVVGGTYLPKAELARQVLLEQLPGCVVSDFKSQPLGPVSRGALS